MHINIKCVPHSLISVIHEHQGDVVEMDVAGVHSNIVHIDMKKPDLSAKQFCELLAAVRFTFFLITNRNKLQ